MDEEDRLKVIGKLRALSLLLDEWIGREAMLRSRIVLNECKKIVGEVLVLVEAEEKSYLESITGDDLKSNSR